MIFEEIVPEQALHLMNDVFGNYVSRIIFLFWWCPTPCLGHSEAVRARYSSSASGALQCHEGEHPDALAWDVRLQGCPKGTYSLLIHARCLNSCINQAIDCGSVQQQSAIVSELNGHILQCVKSSNGNHVRTSLCSGSTNCLTAQLSRSFKSCLNALNSSERHLYTHSPTTSMRLLRIRMAAGSSSGASNTHPRSRLSRY